MKFLNNLIYTRCFVLIIFFVSIVVDNINGYLQDIDVNTPIGILYRGTILFLLSSLLLKKKCSYLKLTFYFIIVLYLLFIPIWAYFSYGFAFSSEMIYLFRIIYFALMLVYFDTIEIETNYMFLIKCVYRSSVTLSVLNIICYILDIGIRSYGEDFGFGLKAFYSDGNSLALYMICSVPLVIWYTFLNLKLFNLLGALIVTLGTFLIGTRAAILGCVISWLCISVYFLIKKDSYFKESIHKKFSLCILLLGFLCYSTFTVISFITAYDEYTYDKFTVNSAISSRKALIDLGKHIIYNRSDYSFFIGNGFSGGSYELGQVYSSGREIKIIEADNYDLLLNFGFLYGGILILMHMIFLFYVFIKPFIYISNSLSFTLLIIGLLWYGASVVAGHGFFNTMLVPLIGVSIVLSKKCLNYDRKRN